jgi:predicted transcriptional regulator
MTKKRERLEVIHDILEAAREEKGEIKPTRLLFSSNLSPQMFKEYTEELLAKRFLEQRENAGKKTFIMTRKGYDFLEKYKVIREFVENFGL